MGYLKSTGTAFIYISLFLAILTFIPGLLPDCEFSEYSITPSKELSGKLAPNDRLNRAELLHVNEIKGAEYFDSYNGELYTGIHGGFVAKINENEIIPFVKFGQKCDGIWQEDKCGRPLGLKFDKKGNLYVVDTYYGIFKVQPDGKYEKIIDISEPIGGKVPRFPNSLDIAKNGDIYWTVSSTDFPLYDGIYTGLANPSGRLIKYNAAKKTNEVLLDNLAFANGVKLSEDESFLLIAETIASRIIKYYIKGAKAGQKEVIAEGLPGFPDNIHSDSQGGFLTSLVIYADANNPQLYHTLAPHPYIRKMLARLLILIELPFKLLQDFYPNVYAEKFLHGIGSFEPVMSLGLQKVVILRHDTTGNIVDAAYSTDGTLQAISSVFVHNGYLWLGSPMMEYVARVPLKQVFPDLAKTEEVAKASNAQKIENAKEQPKIKDTITKTEKVKATTPPPTEAPVVKEKQTASATVTKTTTTTQTTTESTAPKQIHTKQPTATPKPVTTPQPSTTTAKSSVSQDSTKTTTKPNNKATSKSTQTEEIKKVEEPAGASKLHSKRNSEPTEKKANDAAPNSKSKEKVQKSETQTERNDAPSNKAKSKQLEKQDDRSAKKKEK